MGVGRGVQLSLFGSGGGQLAHLLMPPHPTQAIGLLDELDKEINIYAMRTKEWYGWHFPEMAKVVNDNLQYAKGVLKMGFR